MARNYKITRNEDRERLLRVFNDGGDVNQTANILGIKLNTAYKIIRSGRVEAHNRGGANNRKVTEEMREYMRVVLENNPLITLQEVKNELRRHFPNMPNVSISTIKSALDGMFYTLKQAVDQPANRNSVEVVEARFQYANWFLGDGVNEDLIFIDEVGANLWTRRCYGRAIKGQPCYRTVGNQRGKNQTTIMAINKDLGLVHFEIKDGGINTDDFSNFLANMAMAVDNHPYTLILDNARAHHGAGLEVPENFRLKFLPPYSPILNPIENVFSAMKASLKRQLAVVEPNEEERALEQRITLVAYRRNRNYVKLF